MKLGELVRQGCPECKALNALCLAGKKGFRQEIYWVEEPRDWRKEKGRIEWRDEDDPNYMDLTVSCDLCNFVAYVMTKYGRPEEEFEVRLEGGEMKKAADYLHSSKTDLLKILYDAIEPCYNVEDLEKTGTKATNLWQLNQVTMAALVAAFANREKQ